MTRMIVWMALGIGVVACSADSHLVDAGGADAVSAAGRFEVSWRATVAGAPVTCADLGVDQVRVRVVGSTDVVDELFPCVAGAGTTQDLPLGEYAVSVHLLDSDRDLEYVASAPRGVRLEQPGEVGALEPFVIALLGTGEIEYAVDFGAYGGSNCAAAGGPVSAHRLRVAASNNTTCLPVQLRLGGEIAAADPCGTDIPCVEPDVQHTIVGLEPGVYDLTLEGVADIDDADTVCFRSIEVNIDVFDADTVVELGTLLVPFDDSDDPDGCGAL